MIVTPDVASLIAGGMMLATLLTCIIVGLAYTLPAAWKALRRPRRWLRIRLSFPERYARLTLHMPLCHPERIAGSDRAARKEYFRWLTQELADEGIVAGDITDEHRRGPA